MKVEGPWNQLLEKERAALENMDSPEVWQNLYRGKVGNAAVNTGTEYAESMGITCRNHAPTRCI